MLDELGNSQSHFLITSSSHTSVASCSRACCLQFAFLSGDIQDCPCVFAWTLVGIFVSWSFEVGPLLPATRTCHAQVQGFWACFGAWRSFLVSLRSLRPGFSSSLPCSIQPCQTGCPFLFSDRGLRVASLVRNSAHCTMWVRTSICSWPFRVLFVCIWSESNRFGSEPTLTPEFFPRVENCLMPTAEELLD